MRWQRVLVLVPMGLLGCEQILFGPSNDDALDCRFTPIDLDPDIVRACVLRASCSPSDPFYDLSTCIEGSVPLSSDYDRCTLSATSCADIETCFATPASLQERATVACNSNRSLPYSCDGDVQIWCQEGDLGIPFDCARAGGECRSVQCFRAGCEEALFEDSCDEACLEDGRLQFCLHDYPQVLDCTDYGFTECVLGTQNEQVRCR